MQLACFEKMMIVVVGLELQALRVLAVAAKRSEPKSFD